MRRLALAALLLGACTFLTQFNPEGQPCDTTATNEADRCLTHFHCAGGKCVSGDYDAGSATDGGQ